MFSILVANYNNARFIKETFESILAQTTNDWEVIIVDDGSTDNSIEIINPYLTDSRFKLFTNKENKGCGYTKRHCVELANGNICGFLDPDDTLISNAVEVMLHEHTRYPEYALVYSNHYICDEKLQRKKASNYTGAIKDGFSYLINPNKKVIHHFASFKKELYEKTAGINAGLKKAIDQDLYYKLEETGRSFYIDKVLYNYRIHDKGISTYSNILAAAVIHFKIRIAAFKRRKNNKTIDQLYPKDKILFKYQMYRSKMYLRRYSNKILKAAFFLPVVFVMSPGQFFKDYIIRKT